MKKQLVRIGPLKSGIIQGIICALLALLVVPFILLAIIVAPKDGDGAAPGVALEAGMAFLIPIVYGIVGFVMGVITAAIYNLVAGWTGGLEFTVRDVPTVE
jgi:hypothetical protein